MTETAEQKKALRKSLLEQRRTAMKMFPDQKKANEHAIFSFITGWEEYRQRSILLVYASTGEEIDTFRLISHALSTGKRVACPRCESAGVMRFYEIGSISDLVIGRFGIYAPDEHCAPAKLDDALCIVPGLAFDMRGYRVGYGGGYYDRFLPDLYNMGGFSVGLCLQENLHNTLPAESFDRQVNAVVTQSRIIRCV